ncbi:hypothetical protein MUK70_11630 [Dyadobacter chenwenxiniae]|uniref:Uncharacterized protein n=1 Tax=Dyadobacter chenwenxiniae TaxID=2906456 RepID=A0A9X1TD38_9BACT|nr:hypothetical protein [Dyadobacter chenwenxiniae]MCF0059890.1 hypothetical protein [Dyadobacter chenwenxiniae]UON85630.1 hypothetical protein MUK70_11630 [Dyadobacter chenwenxiniae]
MTLPQTIEHLLIWIGESYSQVLMWLADEQVYANACAGIILAIAAGILAGFWWSTKFDRENSGTYKQHR